MATRIEKKTLRTNCGKCGSSIKIDATFFEPNAAITSNYQCKNGHEYTISVRGARIIWMSPSPIIESDIDDFVDVPDHIKKLVKEAYKSSAYDIPIAGACVVRRLLDELLYGLGCRKKYVGSKVTEFETKCNNDPVFKQNYLTLFNRLSTFRTIASLGGYHAHAHGSPIVNVIKSEFDLYLHAVEASVKEKWPNRRSP